MTRRLVGVLVILLAVVAALTGGAMRPPNLRAGRAPGPDPPTVGDCLAPGRDPAATPSRASSRAHFAPCTGEHLGEVVAVLGPPLPAATDGPPDCTTPMMRYAGLEPRGDGFAPPGDDADDPVTWSYSLQPVVIWVRQWPGLPPAASEWAACVVMMGSHDDGSGRLANAFDGGALPVDLATCWAPVGSTSLHRLTNCAENHTAELIAVGSIRDPASAGVAAVVESCSRQAARVTGLADPTLGGQLTVTLGSTERNSPVIGGQLRTILSATGGPGPLRRVDCLLAGTGGREFTGTVIGLHHRPIHFVR